MPDALGVEEYAGPAPTLRQSQDWGMAWLETGATPLARVPSAIVPVDRNMLSTPSIPMPRDQHRRRKPLPVGPSAVQHARIAACRIARLLATLA